MNNDIETLESDVAQSLEGVQWLDLKAQAEKFASVLNQLENELSE